MTTLAAKLRQEPGIDMKRLKLGTRLMVETESAVYEMRVLHQELCLVEISSSDPQLRQPTVGQFVSSQLSSEGPAGMTPACEIPAWLGKGLRMYLRFRNGYYLSSAVQGAEVKGDTWHYSVF
jgi:hypothetical protein